MSPKPSKPSTKSVTSMRLDTDLLNRARDAAWAERMSLTAYFEQALAGWLEEHPPPKMPK